MNNTVSAADAKEEPDIDRVSGATMIWNGNELNKIMYSGTIVCSYQRSNCTKATRE